MKRVAATVLMLICAACAAEEATNVAPTNGSAREPLDGRTFISRSVDGHDLVEGTHIQLNFRDGQVGATAGCNSLGAPYSLVDDELVIVGGGMSQTEMGCDAPRHDQDAWLSGFLTSMPTVRLNGNELRLTANDVTIELLDREVADPDRDLVGTTWQVDTILNGDSASSVEGVVTLAFPTDTSFEATAKDCTSAEGTMTVTDDTITFDEFNVDDIACPSPWAETLEVLGSGETPYEIDAGRLTIRAGRNGIGAVAQD